MARHYLTLTQIPQISFLQCSRRKRYGQKVWESYLENHKPAAGRIFWVYGPDKNDITIIGIEPHPNDKKDAYQKITLSSKSEAQVGQETEEENKADKKKKK